MFATRLTRRAGSHYTLPVSAVVYAVVTADTEDTADMGHVWFLEASLLAAAVFATAV